MKNLRLAWEPQTALRSDVVATQVLKYMDNEATFAQFPNDSCLMLKPVENLHEVIVGSLTEARRIPDFRVFQMKEGDFLVFFASALLVYVGKEEFASIQGEVTSRRAELLFPSESFASPHQSERAEIEFLVGIYARGKLQRDAWALAEYKIVKPKPSS
jgi:hypothetical protein